LSASPVFISYSRRDKVLARRVTDALRASDIPLWMDQDDIHPGQQWDQAIEQAIDRCSQFVVLLSSTSIVSEIVLDEIHYALETRKRILPVVVEPCRVPLRLKRLELLELNAEDQSSLDRLVAAIRGPLDDEPGSVPREAEQSFAYHPGQRYRPSIAVLPFNVLSGDASAVVLSDGLLAEVVEALSRNAELFVIASATTRAFRGQSRAVKDIAIELRVGYLLVGQLTVVGSRLRVACELVSANSGHVIWSDHFDRPVTDLFDVQDRIARSIVHQLQRGLGVHERNQIVKRPPDSWNAWEIFQEARHYEWSAEWLRRSIVSLERAIKLDPRLAEAHALLAARRAYMMWFGDFESLVRSLTDAERSLELAPDNTNCLVCSSIAYQYNGQPERALTLIERAVELNPNSADAWAYNGSYLAGVRRNREALEMLDYAFELSPKDPARYLWYAHKVVCFANEDDYARALAACLESTRLNDQWFWTLMAQAQSYAMLDHPEEARRDWSRARRLNPSLSVANFRTWLETSALTSDQKISVVSALTSAGCE
jgi:TolB-like protein/cytochrome c-type biogenesis protein CcmH/NrfG